MSIRLRLTLWYTIILALTLIVFSVTLYTVVSRVTLSIVKDTLINETRRLISTPRFQPNGIELPALKFTPPQLFVQTLTPDGAVLQARPDRDDFALPLSPETLSAVQGGQALYETTATENGKLLIYSAPVRIPGIGFVGIVQVAQSLDQRDGALDILRRILIIGSGIVTLTAFGSGWVLAGIALRPIHRLTRTAQAIGAERDFGRRVDHTGPLDEIGRLATTFNDMLGALQAAYIQEAHALQAQRRFVADASHELRTPLTTIRGNIGLLQREPPISADDRVAVLDDMADETERMSRLVNDLLVLARADAGRALRSEPVPLRPLLDEMCRKASLLTTDHTITCNDPPETAILGDPDALKQVLLILLDNAIKFTPPGGLIDLGSRVQDGRVLISVRDTGGGIAPAAVPHIFERFYRGDTSRTGAGAGLGLAIAKTLVEGQRGTIAVESEPGRGSIFTLSLPQVAFLPAPESIDEPIAIASR